MMSKRPDRDFYLVHINVELLLKLSLVLNIVKTHYISIADPECSRSSGEQVTVRERRSVW